MDSVFCDICNTIFSSKRTLAVHKKSHALDYKVPCPTCKKVFRKTYLNKHMLNCFPAEEPQTEFKCQFCMKTFGRLQHLNRHLEVHDGMFVNESCNLCPKTFDRNDNLKRHVKNVHEMVVDGEIILVKSKKVIPQCEMCNINFSKRSSLTRHMNLKHKGYDEQTKERLVFGPNVFILDKAQTKVSDVENFAKEYVEGILEVIFQKKEIQFEC